MFTINRVEQHEPMAQKSGPRVTETSCQKAPRGDNENSENTCILRIFRQGIVAECNSLIEVDVRAEEEQEVWKLCGYPGVDLPLRSTQRDDAPFTTSENKLVGGFTIVKFRVTKNEGAIENVPPSIFFETGKFGCSNSVCTIVSWKLTHSEFVQCRGQCDNVFTMVSECLAAKVARNEHLARKIEAEFDADLMKLVDRCFVPNEAAASQRQLCVLNHATMHENLFSENGPMRDCTDCLRSMKDVLKRLSGSRPAQKKCMHDGYISILKAINPSCQIVRNPHMHEVYQYYVTGERGPNPL
ncbi:unnamed protein product [Soboliphyme baturini]|uniref:Saposin B-type domain-containing protein n=1 Tax=Soboliphyme baturini TaxID=241478 RepID=A0A183ISC1_9BILA|nr:unnamed protein product [Soboliphyme baturini]